MNVKEKLLLLQIVDVVLNDLLVLESLEVLLFQRHVLAAKLSLF